MSDERGNTISALSLGSPNIWPMAAAYIMCVQVTSIQNISRVLSLAGETEGDTVPSKYSPTHLWMLGFLLHLGPSSLSFSFLFPWHWTGSKCMGTEVFGIPGMEALLSFSICRKRDMLCWERGVPSLVRVSPVEQPPESGYGALSVPLLRWNRDRLSRRLRTQCCLSVLSFTGMLLHLLPSPWTPPRHTGKYQPNCPDSVNHFLPTGAASPPIHVFLFMELQWYFFSPPHPALHEMDKTTELEQPLQTEQSWRNYAFYACYAEYARTCPSSKWSHMVQKKKWIISPYLVISCNHKACLARFSPSLW